MTDNEIIVVIRPSFKKVCEGDSCRAAALNHILYWIGRKRRDGCGYWYCKGEAIYHGLAETWGITAVRREVNALIDCNYVGEMRNPKWGSDRTKHFYFGDEQLKALFTSFDKFIICPFCIGLPDEITDLFKSHLINLSNANDNPIKCICQKHQMELINLLNPFDKSDTAITKITYKDYNKEREDDSVDAARIDTPAPALSHSPDGYMNHSSQKGHTYEPDDASPADYPPSVLPDPRGLTALPELEGSTPPPAQVAARAEKGHADGASANDHPASDVSIRQVDSDLDHSVYGEAEAVELVVKPRYGLPCKPQETPSQQTPAPVLSPPSLVGPPTDETVPEQATLLPPIAKGAPSAAIASSATTTPHGSSAQRDAGASKSKGGKGTQAELKEPPQKPSEDAPWGTNTCRQLFDYWRHKPLLADYQLREASKLAKALSQNYTREQVENVRNYMLNVDEWWSEHPAKVDIFSVAKHIHEKLEEMERKVKPRSESRSNGKVHPVPVDIYTQASLDPERNQRNRDRMKARIAAREAAQQQGYIN